MRAPPINPLDAVDSMIQQGLLAEARARCASLLGQAPQSAAVLFRMGRIFRLEGAVDAACDWLRRAVEARQAAGAPSMPPTEQASLYGALGEALLATQHFDEARSAFESALRHDPAQAPALVNFANLERELGRFAQAEALLRRAIASRPGHSIAHNNLATVLARLDRLDEAMASCARAIALRPEYAAAHRNLAAMLRTIGRMDEAEKHARRAIALEPGRAGGFNTLGNILSDSARHEDATSAYEAAIAIDTDDAGAQSNLLLALISRDDLAPQDVFERHRQWGLRHASVEAADGANSPQRPSSRPTGRESGPVRVGLVSPDYCRHSVAYFIEPLLAQHRRDEIHLTCFSSTARPDGVTARLQRLADGWVDIALLDDIQAAAAVREARIDILIDLAGHTADNRLGVFAQRPAAVQGTFLGYPATTGLPQIDFRITDSLADPPGAEALHTEALIRLDPCFLCYAPPEEAPPVAPAPCAQRGSITFGCFNAFSKTTPAGLDAWSAVLQAVPAARLVLKARALGDGPLRNWTLSEFSRRGIDPSRVDLLPHLPGLADHLAAYSRIDIALDAFPYNGATTTCEALWMGVPVVSLAGPAHASRVGLSLLSAASLPQLAAGSVDEFARIAAGLAADLPALAALRAGLRARLTGSILLDASAFARRFESAILGAALLPR